MRAFNGAARAAVLALASFAGSAGCGTSAEKDIAFKYREGFTLTQPIRCTYQESQSVTDMGLRGIALKQRPNSKPIVWEFRNTFKSLALVNLGGEAEAVAAIPYLTVNSVSMILPRRNGVHLFTVWNSGVSVWTKHDTIQGLLGANQFLGACENLEAPAVETVRPEKSPAKPKDSGLKPQEEPL
ncbi:MAG: hypothetical protein HY922_13165 [Elusimicrobia bacterium]|nr:hypothetical protein [Elusimicrobiota bacterium]